MSELKSLAASVETAVWPAFEAIPAERVIAGEPVASTLSVSEIDGAEFGLWQVTPGEFKSARDGYSEYVYIISGVGEIVGDDGTVHELKPGAVVFMHDGWSGRWVIRETLTKSYSIVYTR